MAFKTSSGKVATTQYGEPYIWGTGDVTTLPSNETIIQSADAAVNDFFGNSVAVGSGRIVVGAPGDDDNGAGSGSAYIFDLNGNQLAKITASDAAANDIFGDSVAVGSGRIVVSATLDDDNGENSGSAYIFDLNGNQLAKILPSDGAATDNFGTSIAVGNNKIVVGARNHDAAAINSGAVYVYNLNGTQTAKLIASDPSAYDYFGHSVAIGNNKIVVGATGDDDNGPTSGSAYIFDLDGNQLAKITASDGAADDFFGRSVAVGSGRIVVGAYADDDNGPSSGSAYIFDLDGNQLAKITASDGAAYDNFGHSVAVGNGRIIVGAPGDESAYVFDLDGNLITKIIPTGTLGNYFSNSVFVNDGKIVISRHNSGATGPVTGNGGGYVYIYNTPSVYTVYELIHNEV